MLTGRKMYEKNFITEAVWMLRGETDTKRFHDNGVKIWDAWADEKGELGKLYGYQLRNFNSAGCDQLRHLDKELGQNPSSRRLLASMWNPLELDEMALPPCHFAFQLVVTGASLNIVVYQRSADVMVGLPYDVAMYGVVLSVFCKRHDYECGTLTVHMGDAHIYRNHFEGVSEYIKRAVHPLPGIRITNSNPFSIEEKEICITNYQHEEAIFFSVAK